MFRFFVVSLFNAKLLAAVSVFDHEMILDAMAAQARRTAKGDPTRYPSQTAREEDVNGTLNVWQTTGASWWSSGFFPGLLWQFYNLTGDEDWVRLALQWTEGMREQQHNAGGRDIGFKVFNSFGAGFLLAGEPGSFAAREVQRLGYKDVVLTAADTLASRFSEVVGCTKSWDFRQVCSMDSAYEAQFPVIIDNMMNLELLFWAAQNGGDVDHHRIAEAHANTTVLNHVRPDGSTHHVVDFDPQTGQAVRKCTHEGLNDTSTWSQGQAWCIYGFTMAYRYTRLPLHLETAQRCADYFLSKVESQVDDAVPLWDFDWPGSLGLERRDVSAAAIAASAFLELAGYVADGLRYRQASERVLHSLGVPATRTGGYLGDFRLTQGALVHATITNPQFSPDGWDISLVFSSYYAMEAVRRSSQAAVLELV